MATLNIIQSKRQQTSAGLAHILSYCKRDVKVTLNNQKLVTGMDVLPQTAYREMMNTKSLFGKQNGRMYYHFVQSFSPNEDVSPDLAHRIATEFAEKEFKGYEVLVATHVDKDHIHSHLIVNSVNAETGKKYHSDKDSLKKLRKSSDEVCEKFGLEILPPKDKSETIKKISSKEYRTAIRGESWKMQLVVTVEDAMKTSKTKGQFIAQMKKKGYGVTWTDNRKYITYTTPDGNKCRDIKMHEIKFTKENMENEFRIRSELFGFTQRDSKKTADGVIRNGNMRDGNREKLESTFGPPADTITSNANASKTNEGQSIRRSDEGLYEHDPRLSKGGISNSSKSNTGVPEENGTDNKGLYTRNEGSSEECFTTGWEHERGILLQNQGDGEHFQYNIEEYNSAVFDPNYTSGDILSDSAFLVGTLIDGENNQEIEDCTTINYGKSKKKKEEESHGQVMGGM